MSSFIRFLSKRLGPQAPRGGGWAWETWENRGTFGKSMGKLSRKWSFLELKFFFFNSCHRFPHSSIRPHEVGMFMSRWENLSTWQNHRIYTYDCWCSLVIMILFPHYIYMYRNPQLLFVSSKIQSGI